jgi:RimJ/RimL family protein N-acetyltransferase
MRLLFGQDNEVGRYVGEKLWLSIHPPFVAIGIVSDDGKALGGFVYNNYNGSNLEISYYGPGTLTRPIISAAFWGYPFNDADVLRLTATTRRSNKLVCQLLPRLGFIYEGTLRNYFGPEKGDDGIVYRLSRRDAERWKRGP